MKSKFIIITAIIVIIAFGYLYFINILSKPNPKVLGLSINGFYSKKNIAIDSVPTRKGGAEDPKILSDSSILIEGKTKYPLFAVNEHESVPIASITKIMTYIVSLEQYEIKEIVEISSRATDAIGSKIDLVEGEKITVENLLYGLLVNSGNDAAFALAEHAGSLDGFIEKMNNKAVELGMNDTYFQDPAGLNDEGRSSAFDVALLFSYCLSDDLFREIIKTSEKEITSTDGQIVHKLKNSNRLVTGEIPFEGALGGKTGFTFDAGHTLACAAERNGTTLISVILKTLVNSKTASAYESQKLLNWGFESYNF